jgi:hypothetical protein
MELLKLILDFIARIAYPIMFGLLLILFREQIGGVFEILKQLVASVKGGVETGQVALKYGDFTLSAVQRLRSDNLATAAKTIQDLLSPAAPLALGYVDNFLGGFVADNGIGGFHFLADDALKQYRVAKVFTIFIPRRLSDIESASQNLVYDKYGDKPIKNISIESKYGRPFTAFAVLDPEQDILYPVDVPKTLTSIQHVFRFREAQLKVAGNLGSKEITELENKNLDEFADIVLERTKSLQESGSIRVIRERTMLFQAEP